MFRNFIYNLIIFILVDDYINMFKIMVEFVMLLDKFVFYYLNGIEKILIY